MKFYWSLNFLTLIILAGTFNSWDWFENATIELIWHIPISPNCLEDRWIWTHSISANLMLNQHIQLFNTLWFSVGVEFGSLKLLERHKMLVWRTTTGCMPAKDNLHRFFEVADFSGASVASTQVWFPPIRSYVKINIYAAVGLRFSATAMVARD